MAAYRIEQLVDMTQVRDLLESHQRLSGMAYMLFGTSGNMLASAGMQDVCERFHCVNPASSARCIESIAYMHAHASDAERVWSERRCGNNMVYAALPVIIDGEHMATLFIGQFFYDDNPPDREFFRAQALKLGFDPEEYLAALERVPLLSRTHVYDNLSFLRAMLNVLAETGRNNLRHAREMEERNVLLSAALDKTNDAVFLLDDEQFRFVHVNDAACRSLGYSREELLTMAPPDIDPDITREACMELRDKSLAGLPVVFESQHRARDGRIFTVEVSVSLFVHDGALYSLSVARDITGRKEMENRLREARNRLSAIFSTIPDLVWLKDADGVYQACNSTALEEFFCIAEADIIGKTDHDLMDAGQADLCRQTDRAAISANTLCVNEEEVTYASDGRRVLLEIRKVPVYGVNGEVDGVLGIARDITERKRMEDELQRKNSELERFTYTVSHDLKSPLITIKGFSGSIKNDLASGRFDRLEKDLARIEAAADRMAALLNDLLELSWVGRIINTPEPVDMARLAHDALKNLAGILDENNARVSVQPGLPAVMCDRQRMMEVMQNLIENAVKHRGDQPEPRIEIGLREEGDQQVFFVRDNGPGIDPKYHENIFGLFNRVNTQVVGTGIGLALVKRIIEVHGGSIWVESDGQGNGSAFCFTVGQV